MHTPHTPSPAASSPSRAEACPEVRVRLEGAPWLSLRDRCGARATRASRGRVGARGAASNWRSLSRLEVAMALVLGLLLAGIFQGAQRDPLLAMTPLESTSEAPVAAVSLVE